MVEAQKLSNPTKLFFFGNEQIAQGIKQKSAPIFESLLNDQNYQISALILTSKNPRRQLPIEKIAEKNNIPIYYALDSSQILNLIKEKNPYFAVLASFGKIIPKDIIDSFPKGILNVHPSLLPRYRGTSPIESAILNGDTMFGTTIMQLSAEMDAGDIVTQATLNLKPNAKKQDIFDAIVAKSVDILHKILPSYLKSENTNIAQNHDQATYTQKLQKSDGSLKPEQDSAQILANKVRAYAGFPKSRLVLKGVPCVITEAHAATKPESPLDPLCKDGNYLVIDQLIPENSKPMSIQAFLNGLKNK